MRKNSRWSSLDLWKGDSCNGIKYRYSCFCIFSYRTVCWEMRHTAHVSNQVVKKPSQNPTKTPHFGGEKIRSPTSQTSKLGPTNPTRGNFFLTNHQPNRRKSWGKSWGIMGKSPPKQPGKFSQPTNRGSTQKPQPSTGKAPDIHSSAEPIFPTLPAPRWSQRWFGWWWVGRRCFCWLGSNGKAKVGLYLKKMPCLYILHL